MPRKKPEEPVEETQDVQAPEEEDQMFPHLSRVDLLELNFRHERLERLKQEEAHKRNAAAVIQLQMSAQVDRLKKESLAASQTRRQLEEELVEFVVQMAPKYGFEYADFKEGRVGFDDETGRIVYHD